MIVANILLGFWCLAKYLAGSNDGIIRIKLVVSGQLALINRKAVGRGVMLEGYPFFFPAKMTFCGQSSHSALLSKDAT